MVSGRLGHLVWAWLCAYRLPSWVICGHWRHALEGLRVDKLERRTGRFDLVVTLAV